MNEIIFASYFFGGIMVIFAISMFFMTISRNRNESKNELLDELLKNDEISKETYLKYK